jgi:transposase
VSAISREGQGLFRVRKVTKADTARIIIACSSMLCFRWLARAPWRDLPNEFGNWNSVFQRFRRWTKKGIIPSLMIMTEGWRARRSEMA